MLRGKNGEMIDEFAIDYEKLLKGNKKDNKNNQ